VVLRDPSGRPLAFGSVVAGEYRLSFPGRATFAFRPRDDEVRLCVEPSTPRGLVADLFRTTALPLLLQAEGYEALHASAVQIAGGVVGFCGFSGAGKTTVAFALARRGKPLWADDVVLLLPVAPQARTILTARLPDQPINLRPQSRTYFGVAGDGGAPHAKLADSEEDRLAALVVLERGTPAVEATRLPIDAALTSLLPHAFCFFADPERRQRTIAAYLDLVAQVPVLAFRFPNGFAKLDVAIDLLESRLQETVAST
jgi:hypothetical protein